MTRFDHSDTPLWTTVGAAYLALLEPLRVQTTTPIPGRAPYIKTVRQLGTRPTRDDVANQGYALTQSMPALGVHIEESRVEGRTSQALDWRLDVEVHCFCAVIDRGAELRQDRIDGIRSVSQHVVELLHQRVPGSGLDAQGIEVQSIDHITTTPRVDWWVVRTTVDVRQEIRRQRTAPVDDMSVQQFGKPDHRPLTEPHVIDFETATATTQE